MVKKIFATVSRIAMGTITHVSTSHPAVALTFDDGPDPHWTPQLLDILKRHEARATFFMVGKYASSHPKIVQRVADLGHTIGNHSWDHSSFLDISRRERIKQVRQCAEVIAPYGQRLFRPPMGHQSVASRLDLMLERYRVVAWSFHVHDWLEQDPKWMAERLSERIRPGSIVLLHDAVSKKRYKSRKPTIEAVDILLEQVQNRLRFVSLSELFHLGRPIKQNWYMKP